MLFQQPSFLPYKPPVSALFVKVGYFSDGFACATQGEISRASFFQKQLAFSNRLTFTIEIYGY